jgi:hypothetical protein
MALLTGLFLLALALRVGLVLALRGSEAGPATYEHGQIAANLLAGRGFTTEFLGVEGKTSQQAPLYPCFLAVSFWMFGVETPASILAVQLVQCVAGALLVVVVARLGWAVAADRPWMGWLAGGLACVYPTHVYMVTHVQVAVWAALGVTGLMLLVLGRSCQTWPGAVATGVVSAMVVLIDPILVLAVAAAGGAFWLQARRVDLDHGGRSARMRAVAAWLLAAALVTPWMVRNYHVHGEVVFIKSSFGYAVWQGNNSVSWGTDKVPKASAEQLRLGHDGSLAGVNRSLWEARHETLYIDDVLLKPAGYGRFQGLSEPARSRVLLAEAVDFIRHNPGRYARLCLRRLGYFLWVDETNPKAKNPVYRASSLFLLIGTAGGILASLGRWRTLWPTWAAYAALALFHTLTIVSARFRIPVEPLALVWTAMAAEFAIRPWLKQRPIASSATRRSLAGWHVSADSSKVNSQVQNSG